MGLGDGGGGGRSASCVGGGAWRKGGCGEYLFSGRGVKVRLA